MGLTALLTAGENGEPIAILLGDCAAAVLVMKFDVEPGVSMELDAAVLDTSAFVGMSTWRSTDFLDGVSGGAVDDGHGGAAGSVGCGIVPGETSEGGASGISSILGSGGLGVVTSASPISMSLFGGGVDSLAGVGSRGVVSIVGPPDVSIVEGSSSGGEGGSGEGLFDDTSLSAGDPRSIFTDVDLRRSRWSLSSCAC
jgi:hypothetical protein